MFLLIKIEYAVEGCILIFPIKTTFTSLVLEITLFLSFLFSEIMGSSGMIFQSVISNLILEILQ